MRFKLAFLALATALAVHATTPKPMVDGLLLDLGKTHLKVGVYAESIIRVTASPAPDASVRPSIAAVPADGVPFWTWKLDGDDAVILTKSLQVRVNTTTGQVRFFDAAGQPILMEKNGDRLTPAVVQGEQTFHVAQKWEPHDDEAFLGLGQNQLGIVDVKGYDISLWQRNTVIGIPFVVSTRGYGILWDNTSELRWGDIRPFAAIPASAMLDRDGKPGALTATYNAGKTFSKAVATQRDTQINIRLPDKSHGANALLHKALPTGEASIRWEGFLVPAETGDYQFNAYFDGDFKLWIDGKQVINHWRQDWLAGEDLVKISLQAGKKVAVRMEWIRDNDSTSLTVTWKTPSADKSTSMWSEVGDGVDYYFVYGPALEKVVAGYRQITGAAAMLPRWAYGFWQSRERYETQQASLDVVKEYRKRGIPFDNIVQDWQYWHIDQWGSHRFDSERFPDPAGWVKALHEQHAHLMISVWGKFYAGTDTYEELLKGGYLYEPNIKEHALDFLGYPFAFVDAFNPAARDLFWARMKERLLPFGIDAWWMDASEPDLSARPEIEDQKAHINPNHMGTGARMLLGYPLMLAKSVYDGQRHELPDQRVFNLTRSGYLGLQRYGAASWSGDITSTWTAMKKQIAAGISYAGSGLPYWTMDSGGFSVPARFDPAATPNSDVDEWREMNARWFEFATFVPLMRLHGQRPFRELWCFGDAGTPAYDAMLATDRLRYRLLPYIYSVAGAVVQDGTTILRPLGFAFPQDREARSLNDQYLFGPAFLVSPVTEYKQRSRSVYLPATEGGWYDLWTGSALGSGKRIDAAAPYDRIPVTVRAGSIVPFGPDVQYALEKAQDPITLYVYAGRDGDFSLYEDDGLTYGYEKGAFSRIHIQWNDASRTLTIGKREGEFPGMLTKRTFKVIVVGPKTPQPLNFEPKGTVDVEYAGETVTKKL